MLLNIMNSPRMLLKSMCRTCRVVTLSRCNFSDSLYNKYTDEEKTKILQVINYSELDALSSYDISKVNIKKIFKFRSKNGQLNSLDDIEQIDGISERSAKKIFSGILEGQCNGEKDISNRIKGQFLYPKLHQSAIEECGTVISIFVTVNSVCWTQINKDNYEVIEWKYHGIDYPDNKRLHITDILEITWRIIQKLPEADIYVMKAEATTLRAGGSDPNNPKVLAVNLQKAQMISMIVALLTARYKQQLLNADTNEDTLNQNVYFLRPTLPYRIYGTLVGKERVSTEQTVEMLLNDFKNESSNNSHAYIPEHLQNMFRSKRDLQKDMLGHCLLLGLTFMDLCVYKNKDRIAKLIKQTS